MGATNSNDARNFQFVYTSTATARLDRRAIDKLLGNAQTANNAVNVTGFLLFDGANFLQLLEGQQDDVEATFNRIKKSSQHRNVEPLMQDKTDSRNFSTWSMAFSQVDENALRAFGGTMNALHARELTSMLKQNANPMRLVIADFLETLLARQN